MNIKRFIFNRLFNKRQRRVIWQAVLFSEHTYKRRGNVEAAADVRTVINEVIKIAGVEQQKFYESEVVEIVKREVAAVMEEAKKKIENAYNEGKKVGANQVVSEIENKVKLLNKNNNDNEKFKVILGFAKPIEVDLEKCEDCEHKDDCPVKSAMENAETESDSEDEKEQNQEREITVEGDSSDAPESDDEDKDKHDGEE